MKLILRKIIKSLTSPDWKYNKHKPYLLYYDKYPIEIGHFTSWTDFDIQINGVSLPLNNKEKKAVIPLFRKTIQKKIKQFEKIFKKSERSILQKSIRELSRVL